MSRVVKNFAVGSALLVCLSTSAFAQATRTWVSGTGDDVNPCSRTAPCKTFQGAISKTAAGGEINAIDSAGYGPVTINKSLTIDGGPYLSSILAAGTNGINVNAGVNDVINIRRIALNGASHTTSAGLRGIRVIQAGQVNISNVDIFGFSDRGLSIESNSAVKVNVSNSRITDAHDGIFMLPPAGAPSQQLVVENTDIIQNSLRGMYLANGASATITNSKIAENGIGIVLELSAGSANANVTNSMIASNGTAFTTTAAAGIALRLSKNAIFNNTAAWTIGGANVFSYGDNQIAGNGAETGTLGAATPR